jgi:hypothetical protein
VPAMVSPRNRVTGIVPLDSGTSTGLDGTIAEK